MPTPKDHAIKAINFISGIFIFICGIMHIAEGPGFGGFIVAAYLMAFGLVICGLEFYSSDVFITYTAFYFNFLGRALFYLFLGGLIVRPKDFGLAAGLIVFGVALMNLAFHFVPSIQPPPPEGWARRGNATSSEGSAAPAAGPRGVQLA